MEKILEKAHVADKVKGILQQFPIVMKDKNGEKIVEVSLSVGVIFTRAGEHNEYEELYRRADKFMYKAKKGGKRRAVMEVRAGKEQLITV